jgi:hypothetical protein
MLESCGSNEPTYGGCRTMQRPAEGVRLSLKNTTCASALAAEPRLRLRLHCFWRLLQSYCLGRD